ncbi:MAG: PDDEXK nuclease domain-containing protein [Desulfobacula sp.]|nr:PDDEXK nuclease domain-containing protein [Desulfobacula sp.]
MMHPDIDAGFGEIRQLIDQARKEALKNVNTRLIQLNWQIGGFISQKLTEAHWGDKKIEQLAEYLKSCGPDYNGFTRRNLYRMKQFYDAYNGNEIVSPLVTQLAWSHHLLILSKAKMPEEREFYIRLAIRERYSKRELERQLDAAVYERTMLSGKSVVPDSVPRHNIVIKDSYVFEFLGLPEEHSESDFKKALIKNLKLFILELGKDFLFIGEEFRVPVGLHDYFIDLLFYHRELQCLIAFELKIMDFKPEYLGIINFYLEALDRDIRKSHENPSIGVLLCKGRDEEVVEYALSRSLAPAKIADYTLKLPDKKQLQRKLHELFENVNYEKAIEKEAEKGGK